MAATFWITLPKQENLRHGTTLKQHQEVWDQLFPHSQAADWVRNGFKISAPANFSQKSIPREVPESQRQILRPLKQKQFENGICEMLPGQPTPQIGVCYMKSFPVPKATAGKFRDCIDARPLNQETEKTHFKGEGLKEFVDMLQPWDWALSSDWEGWFNHATLHPDSRPLCRTVLDGQIIQYICVTFGLTEAPFWLHSLVRPLFALLRSLRFRMGGQADDWAWLGQSFLDCLVCGQVGLAISCMLGFILNSKGSLIPSQHFSHLGGFFNTTIFHSFLARHRLQKIRRVSRQILNAFSNDKQMCVKQVASLVGMISQSRHFVIQHRIRMFELMLLVQEVTALRGWESLIHLTPQLAAMVLWWLENVIQENGRLTRDPHPTLTIVKDASQWGWGAHLMETGEVTHAFWDKTVAGAHSTVLELVADIKAAESFINMHNLHNMTIGIKSDATTSVAYINKQGGRMPHLARPVIQFMRKCWDERRITFTAMHIAGVDNEIADSLSRLSNAWGEISLSWTSFRILESMWGPHTIDLMATETNAKVDRYCSWKADPGSVLTDIFAQTSLTEMNAYVFPPDILISRLLTRVPTLLSHPFTIVAPLWPAQAWYPTLINLLVDYPVVLNHPNSLLMPPLLQAEPAPTWTLVAWRICGQDSLHRAFRERLLRDFSGAGNNRTFGGVILTDLSTTGFLSPRDEDILTRTLTSLCFSTS